MNKVLVGFTAGLLVGILFAPGKGSDTRDGLARKGRDLKNKFNDMVDSISEKFETVQEEAEDLMEKGRQRAQAYRNEVG